ncbi:hypothetical protein ACO0QE_000676 [Hanseniaspora vineae]
MSDFHQLLTLSQRPITKDNLHKPVLVYLQQGIPATYTLEDAILERFGVVLASSKGRNKGLSGSTTPLHILCRSVHYWNKGYDLQEQSWLKDGLVDLDLSVKETGQESQDGERMKCTGGPFTLQKNQTKIALLSEQEYDVILQVMDLLFEYGAGWNFLDFEGQTIGELLLGADGEENQLDFAQNQGLKKVYQRCVTAGVQAELLLRKFEDIEWVEEPVDIDTAEESEQAEQAEQAEQNSELETQLPDCPKPEEQDPAGNQETYLDTKLEYTKDGSALVTETNRDGVMMDWETDIMELAASTLCKRYTEKAEDLEDESYNVLNIGFGMGIIDGFIKKDLETAQSKTGNTYKQYICEAHPDVLQKLRTDGWYDNPNVVILEGRWQDCLNDLLDKGTVFFDAIYYDTFSEHYQDMLDLYDLIIGLIKPAGVFSFFNGLGADNRFFYDVYKEIVVIDMNNYGLQCVYETVDVAKIMEKYGQVWDNVKQSYFSCKHYYHPTINFQ